MITDANGESGDARPGNRPTAVGTDTCILVPLFAGESTTHSRNLATALARERGEDVHFVRPVRSADRPTDSWSAAFRDDWHAVGREVHQVTRDETTDVTATGTVRTGGRPSSLLATTIEESNAGLFVCQSGGETSMGDEAANRLAARTDCSVVTSNGHGNLDDVASILVPVAGGPHSQLAVAVARALGNALGAWVELFHVAERSGGPEAASTGERYLDTAAGQMGQFEETDTWLYEADDAAEAIIEQSRYYDLTVMGAPVKSRLRQFVFGSTTGDVREAADSPVVTVRSNTDATWLDRWVRGEE